MVTKSGQFRTKIPSQYKSKKKKVLAREGDKYNYSIEKCPVCSKQKMEKYDLIDNNGSSVTMRKCKNCGFTNASAVVWENKPVSGSVTYFKPAGSLEDKSKKKK